jgi:hypothetical protein
VGLFVRVDKTPNARVLFSCHGLQHDEEEKCIAARENRSALPLAEPLHAKSNQAFCKKLVSPHVSFLLMPLLRCLELPESIAMLLPNPVIY